MDCITKCIVTQLNILYLPFFHRFNNDIIIHEYNDEQKHVKKPSQMIDHKANSLLRSIPAR